MNTKKGYRKNNGNAKNNGSSRNGGYTKNNFSGKNNGGSKNNANSKNGGNSNAIKTFVLGSFEKGETKYEFIYDHNSYSIVKNMGEEKENLLKTRESRSAYKKWNEMKRAENKKAI